MVKCSKTSRRGRGRGQRRGRGRTQRRGRGRSQRGGSINPGEQIRSEPPTPSI
jgi:hypothetical protein